MEEWKFRFQELPRVAARQLGEILQDVSDVHLQSLPALLHEVKVEIPDFLLRREVEDLDLKMLLLELLVEFVEVAVALEDRPTLASALGPQVDFVDVKVLRLRLLQNGPRDRHLKVGQRVDLRVVPEEILQPAVLQRQLQHLILQLHDALALLLHHHLVVDLIRCVDGSFRLRLGLHGGKLLRR